MGLQLWPSVKDKIVRGYLSILYDKKIPGCNNFISKEEIFTKDGMWWGIVTHYRVKIVNNSMKTMLDVKAKLFHDDGRTIDLNFLKTDEKQINLDPKDYAFVNVYTFDPHRMWNDDEQPEDNPRRVVVRISAKDNPPVTKAFIINDNEKNVFREC